MVLNWVTKFAYHQINFNLKSAVSRMWLRVVLFKFTDISEEHTASIIRVEDILSKQRAGSKHQAACGTISSPL
jgi:hypothetical protein